MTKKLVRVRSNFKKILSTAIFLFAIFLNSRFILYATNNADQSIGGWVADIYNLLFPIAIVYGVVEIIIAGYQIMRSEGEPNALKEGKDHLTETLIGIVFLILAMVILKVIIKSFLGQ